MKRIVAATGLAILMLTASLAQDPIAERNKAVVRRVFTDILTQGRYDVSGEIYAPDFVNHGATKDVGLDESQAGNRGWRTAFPDLEMVVVKEIAEGDFVTVLWTGRGTNTGSGNGLNATGKKAEGRGISMFRVVNGKIKEEWTEYSQLLLLQELGLFPKRQ
jgi:predicted ester cyclase